MSKNYLISLSKRAFRQSVFNYTITHDIKPHYITIVTVVSAFLGIYETNIEDFQRSQNINYKFGSERINRILVCKAICYISYRIGSKTLLLN